MRQDYSYTTGKRGVSVDLRGFPGLLLAFPYQLAIGNRQLQEVSQPRLRPLRVRIWVTY